MKMDMEKKLFQAFFLLLVGIIVCGAEKNQQLLVGGTTAEKPADDKIRGLFAKPEISNAIFTKIRDKSNSNTLPSEAVPISYKSQVVAGVNYFVKASVKTGESSTEIWWIKIFEQVWTNTLKVTGVTGPKQLSEEVTYFSY